ncbi:MAG TPA: methyl-accepting chemotaxis protein, partial [Cupriavidus sp.]|nr:methyl-accepting chemotaxis protein [Cupriavidus sp.]
NLSIRHGLLATLVIFGLMIVFGAALGVTQLYAASESAEDMHQVSSRVQLLNSAYKDMTRA